MKRILVIEDNLEIRENTAEMLQIKGYAVSSAADGNQGISLALSELPDLILCDIKMPLKSGYEVITILKEDPVASKIPIVFFSTNVNQKEIKHAYDLGAARYIRKPFEVGELIDTINEVLDGK